MVSRLPARCRFFPAPILIFIANLCCQLARAGFNLALVAPEPASRPDGTANEEAERP